MFSGFLMVKLNVVNKKEKDHGMPWNPPFDQET